MLCFVVWNITIITVWKDYSCVNCFSFQTKNSTQALATKNSARKGNVPPGMITRQSTRVSVCTRYNLRMRTAPVEVSNANAFPPNITISLIGNCVDKSEVRHHVTALVTNGEQMFLLMLLHRKAPIFKSPKLSCIIGIVWFLAAQIVLVFLLSFTDVILYN